MDEVKKFGGWIFDILAKASMEKFANVIYNALDAFFAYESNFKCLESDIERLSAMKSDVEQQVKNGELSGKKKRKRNVVVWLEEAQNILDRYHEMRVAIELGDKEEEERPFDRLARANAVDELNSKVGKLIQEFADIGELLVDNYEFRESLVTSELIGDAVKANLQGIMKCCTSVTDKVSIIGIYGKCGVGKTVLAQHIHNLLLKEPYKLHVYWVAISQEYNVSKLQQDIAGQMGVDLSDEADTNKGAAKLNRMLLRKKDFVLVLDDVRNGICWETVGVPVGPHNKGATVIITTQSIQVCLQVGCEENFEIKPLEKAEAWNLFRKKLGLTTALTPDIEEIAKSVAEECGGLPSEIITKALSMRGETSSHVWMNALTELKSPLDR